MIVRRKQNGLQSMRERAFTYIEITLTMVIIAILAAIAVPNFLEAQTRAAVARSRAELGLLQSALSAYRLETRAWPQNRTAGVEDTESLYVLTTPVVYLQRLPQDTFTRAEITNPELKIVNPPTLYRYFNALQAGASSGLHIRDHVDYIPQHVGFVAGLIWGYGPAEAAGYGSVQPLELDPGGYVVITAYDPSNGTTSQGSIYLTFP